MKNKPAADPPGAWQKQKANILAKAIADLPKPYSWKKKPGINTIWNIIRAEAETFLNKIDEKAKEQFFLQDYYSRYFCPTNTTQKPQIQKTFLIRLARKYSKTLNAAAAIPLIERDLRTPTKPSLFYTVTEHPDELSKKLLCAARVYEQIADDIENNPPPLSGVFCRLLGELHYHVSPKIEKKRKTFCGNVAKNLYNYFHGCIHEKNNGRCEPLPKSIPFLIILTHQFCTKLTQKQIQKRILKYI